MFPLLAHTGIVIVSANPIATFASSASEQTETNMNTWMSSPHVFLAANEASSAAVELPFYVNGKLQKTDLDFTTITPYNYGVDYVEANFVVVNPLGVPTSGSSSITISVHVMFTDVEFYVPHADVEFTAQGLGEDLANSASRAIDGVFSVGRKFTGDLFDVARRGVRALTGLHNPNLPALSTKLYSVQRNHPNVVDKPVYNEKMDPYCDYDRVVRDHIFDSAIDEMSLRYLFSKPQYVGSFLVKTADTSGTLCWSRPITPAQQIVNFNYTSTDGTLVDTAGFANLHQLLHSLSRFWRGSIKLHIQSSMTNFHFCKLALVRDYSSRDLSLTSAPQFSQIPNLMTEMVEFSSGGQVQTFELPFCSPMEHLPCTRDWTLNAVQHGIYYIYLVQPLVANGSVPTSINFNVYITLGDDFDFYGYAVDPLRIAYKGTLNATPALEEDIMDFEAQSAPNPVVSVQDGVLNKSMNPTEEDHHMVDLRPIVSMREYGRRYYRVSTTKVTGASLDTDDGIRVFDVAEFLGVRNNLPLSTSTSISVNASTLSIIQSLFLGYCGGGRIKMTLKELLLEPSLFFLLHNNPKRVIE